MIPKVDRRHDSERRPPYGLRKAIEVIKDVIPIEQVAAEYGEFKLLGNGRLLGRCVAQDHDDRTPSLTIYTNSQRFKCYGCGLSGDVIDLEEIAGQHLETWTAVVALSERYGVELPRRPELWHKRQDEKSKLRDMATEARKAVRRERLFKLLVLSGLEFDIEDPNERREAVGHAWDIFSAGMRRIGQ
jgi:DNA primase